MDLEGFEISQGKILKLLQTLKTRKATGPDGISPLILSKAADILAYPVTLTFTSPMIILIVGAPMLIWPPSSSTPLGFLPSFGRHSVSGLSTLGCCLPISFSVALFFCLLVRCLARMFWQDQMIGRRVRTT